MKKSIQHEIEQRCERTLASARPAKLEISVIFTTLAATRVALRSAAALAGDVGARIRLLAIQPVPLAYPINQPHVDIAFKINGLSALVCDEVQPQLEPAVHLYFCRDKLQTLLKLLKPNSLLVIGIASRWWPSPDRLLAATLRSKGHQVVVAPWRTMPRSVFQKMGRKVVGY